jgi:CxxC motif-containing protein
MKKKTLICVVCPNGCELNACIDDNNKVSIERLECKRGYEWAKQELLDPQRTITSSVAVDNGDWPLVSVRTSCPVPLAAIPEVMNAIKVMRVQAPIKLGDKLIPDAAGTGVSVIATRNVKYLEQKV